MRSNLLHPLRSRHPHARLSRRFHRLHRIQNHFARVPTQRFAQRVTPYFYSSYHFQIIRILYTSLVLIYDTSSLIHIGDRLAQVRFRKLELPYLVKSVEFWIDIFNDFECVVLAELVLLRLLLIVSKNADMMAKQCRFGIFYKPFKQN